jgi:hypothetical protein
MTPYKKNAPVFWKWLGKNIYGQVVEAHLEPVTREIKGKNIKRNGSAENPAYLVQSEAGNFALKLHSELQAGSAKSREKESTKKPRMFS